jgi:hypothetical protein
MENFINNKNEITETGGNALQKVQEFSLESFARALENTLLKND